MKISEIMTNVVRTVGPDDPVKNAAVMMRDFDIGCVLVSENKRLLGIVTDRDIVTRALARTGKLDDVTIREVMSRKPVCCQIDDTINQAATIMEEHQIRRLPVMDFKGSLAGVVSLGDIATHSGNDHLSADLIGQVSRHAHVSLTETRV